MTAYRYLPVPYMGEGVTAVDVVNGANGENYYYGEWIKRIVEPILAGIINAAGLNGQVDYTDIIQRTAKRAGSDEYWNIVFPDGQMITDAPKSFVEMLKRIPDFESVYGIMPVTPRYRSLIRPSIYAAAFVMLLEDVKSAPSNVPLQSQVYVKLFAECFYPCAHFKWE